MSLNKLETESIGKLLRQYSIPGIIAMTAMSFYNVADSIFIGHGVGAMAIAGLAITFPLMNLGAAFGSLVGLGGATILSVLLGQKNNHLAQKVLGNVVVLNLIIGLIYTIGVLYFLDEILYYFGASEVTIGYARDYMEILLYGNIITHMYMGLNSILRSSGHPKSAMSTTIFTVIINVVLNPIFIYTFDMGIQGAAIATVISQALALLWIIRHFMNKQEIVHFDSSVFKPHNRIVKDIFGIGVSPFAMNFAACFVIVIINNKLMQFGGDLHVASYGIINRLVFIFIMIVMGINQGLQPIAGFNYGAKRYDRLKKVLNLTIIYGTAVTTVGTTIILLFPKTITTIFTTDQELIDCTAYAVRLMLWGFPLAGFQMVAANFFQSINMPKISILISLSRQVLLLIPLLIILPNFVGLDGVWLSFSIADIIAIIIAAGILLVQYKKLKTNETFS